MSNSKTVNITFKEKLIAYIATIPILLPLVYFYFQMGDVGLMILTIIAAGFVLTPVALIATHIVYSTLCTLLNIKKLPILNRHVVIRNIMVIIAMNYLFLYVKYLWS